MKRRRGACLRRAQVMKAVFLQSNAQGRSNPLPALRRTPFLPSLPPSTSQQPDGHGTNGYEKCEKCGQP